jgi:thiol-disulfide isomerase/thioredoxin
MEPVFELPADHPPARWNPRPRLLQDRNVMTATDRLRLTALALAAATLIAASVRAEVSGEERAHSAGASLIGSPAPALTLKTIDGDTIDLGRLYGHKAVYLKFWATWCVPCREQMPHFEHAYQTAGPNLSVIAVNAGFSDSLTDVQAYRKELGLTMPIVIDDGRLAAALNLRVTPQHIIIDRDGRIAYIGHLADARLDAALAAAKQSPVTAATRVATAAPAAHYAIGDRVAGLSGKALDESTVAFADPEGKRPTVLVFLSPWCESYLEKSRPQRSAACRTVREQVELRAKDPRVRWVGVASGLWAGNDDLAAYRDQYKVEMPLILDSAGGLFREFGVTGVPTLLLVDAQGRLVRRIETPDAALATDVAGLAAVAPAH